MWLSAASHLASLPASVVLPAPWRPASMMTVGGGLGELEAALLAAEDRDELLVDDLHDLLRRVERLVDLVAQGALAHPAGELLDHVEVDVGVEQGATNLADGAVDIRRAELALAAKVLEGVREAIGEVSKGGHGSSSLIC